ncbi:MAG TPA: glycosyltransferase family A protein [Candidatus Hodarchaeales archaeon]|nr:glycosyltransferase family A protein [Candidatus Hodarchaeales archaeon]
MKPLVSIGILVYKRLNFLPHVLQVVSAQDYPYLELIVSDNGVNGTKVPEIVDRCYSRPYQFRQNPGTVSISRHFNQLVDAASGSYFILLSDDDEISPNYVSELVSRMERHPSASVAIAKQEILDEKGMRVRQSSQMLPEILSGPDFIRDAWLTYKYKYECFATFLAKTDQIRACGGFPDFKTGTHNDNALLIKLSLNSCIVFSSKCSFRWRVYDNSHGWSISVWDLAQSTREFLEFLRNDPRILCFSSLHPTEWEELKYVLSRMAWETYFNRWGNIYRKRLTLMQWIQAAFLIPPIPAYYREIASTFWEGFKSTYRRTG